MNISVKYINKKISPSYNWVHYKTFDKENKVVADTTGVCFSKLFSSTIPSNVVKITVYVPRGKLPYSTEFSTQWIEDITELGFPCEVEKLTEESFPVSIYLKEYKYKLEVLTTLTLIRYLHEQHLCYIPEIYYNILLENKGKDSFSLDERFIAIQEAHKLKHEEISYLPIGHSLTYLGNGLKNTTLKQYKNKIKDTDHVYGGKSATLHSIFSTDK